MGSRRTEKLRCMLEELDGIVGRARDLEERYTEQLALAHPAQVDGALNLLHYLALRDSDVRDLQYELASLGLSSLGRSESHVLASVIAVRAALRRFLGEPVPSERAPVSLRKGRHRIRRQTNALFGRKLKGSSVRIMVTLPIEAADDYGLVLDMVRSGMNCARINCAAGDTADWARMVDHVHRARRATGRGCRIFMDLAGPKIRTGALRSGPRILRIRPRVDDRGRVEEPELLCLVADGPSRSPADGRSSSPFPGLRVPLSGAAFDALAPGGGVVLTDASGREVIFPIDSKSDGFAMGRCDVRAYLETGLPVRVVDGRGEAVAEGHIGRLPERKPGLLLRKGDILVVHKDPRPGEEAKRDVDGRILEHAHVACGMPEVLDRVEVGQPVVLDDGKFRGVIRAIRPDEIEVEITEAAPGGAKLKPFKGINLPDSRHGVFGLTEKDRADLPFVIEHADGINVSFVSHPDDVEDLIDELEVRGGDGLGLVLKIESSMGLRHLPGILLAAMEWPRVGVMIARGDLAAEVGWRRLARAQEEILWLCEAAHFPVVWATEVLARLAKKGTPTRGEISDVVMAERAECVMLNKGPHITTTIRTLDSILASMEAYQTKKTALLPQLELEAPDPDEVGRPIGERDWRSTHM